MHSATLGLGEGSTNHRRPHDLLCSPPMRLESLLSVLIAVGASIAPTSVSAQEVVPPVVVLPVVGENVPEPATLAIVQSITARLQSSVVRRAVTSTADATALSTAAACTDAPCLGALATRLSAASLVVVRMTRARARDPLSLRVELIGANGAELAAPAESEVPEESALASELLLALVGPDLDRLGARVEPPAVRAPLLIAVNVPDAAVSVDGQVVGQAPVAAIAIPPGDHVIAVSASGFEPFSRSIAVTPEGARVNVLLEPNDAAARDLAADDAARDEAFGAASPAGDEPVTKKWWFWAAIGGGVVVLAAVITGIAVAAGGDDEQGFPIPPIPGGM